MKLKICGMRDPENIRAVGRLAPDYMGFIFYPKSPRYIGEMPPPDFRTLTRGIKRVGVFVDEEMAVVKERIRDFDLHMVQLHGKEPVEYCRKLGQDKPGLELIKVFSIGDTFAWDQIAPYLEVVDFVLFDTKGKYPGGNGVTFDWQLLETLPKEVPYFLSGGLDVHHVKAVVNAGLKPYALDVNSRFESAPGIKDVDKVRQLTQLLSNSKF
ncbi:MAG: phosphoribosylanthranilate isomerase [Bacteroidota bacterium]